MIKKLEMSKESKSYKVIYFIKVKGHNNPNARKDLLKNYPVIIPN
jgi:hypothetical protein